MWNKDLIKSILPFYEKEILTLQPSSHGAADIWAWLPSSSGLYSAKSGYYEALKSNEESEINPNSYPAPHFNWKANIWNLKTSLKTKLLLRKIGQNALPLGANLILRHINDAAKCPHCEADESTLHMFFHCPFVGKIWDLAPFKTVLSRARLVSVTDGISLASKQICLPPSCIGDGPLFPWLIWTIWTSRNQLIFNKKKTNPTRGGASDCHYACKRMAKCSAASIFN